MEDEIRFGKGSACKNLKGGLSSVWRGRIAQARHHQLRVHLLPHLPQFLLLETKEQFEEDIEEKAELVGTLFYLHVGDFP